MEGLGWHIIAEVMGVEPKILNDSELLKNVLLDASTDANLTVLDIKVQRFSPQGVSILLVIAESHIAIHTWPEYGYAALDVFTCRDEESTWRAYNYIIKVLNPKNVQVMLVKRGLGVTTSVPNEEAISSSDILTEKTMASKEGLTIA